MPRVLFICTRCYIVVGFVSSSDTCWFWDATFDTGSVVFSDCEVVGHSLALVSDVINACNVV